MSDDYVTCTVRIEALTQRAVMVRPAHASTCAAWLPRSTLHGADDRRLTSAAVDTEMDLRVREWIAEREGLI